MPTLPTARQKKPRRRPAVTGSARHSLEQAFVSFTHVAGALENSYAELQGEVRRLRQELEETNRDLTRSLEENERMRLYLKRILKGLPCGVLVFDQQGCLRIANPEARPAVDVLFRSVAKLYQARALAVVMTGMGQDGLRGCEEIREAGGQVLVQDEDSSVVWGMPGFVANAGLADRVLPLEQLGPEIVRRVWRGRTKESLVAEPAQAQSVK